MGFEDLVGADDYMFQVGRKARMFGYVNEDLQTGSVEHELLLAEELIGKRVEEGAFQPSARQARIAKVGCSDEVSDSRQDF